MNFQTITSFEDFEAPHIDAVLKDDPQFPRVELDFHMDRCLVDHLPFAGLFDRYSPFSDACNFNGIKEALKIGRKLATLT